MQIPMSSDDYTRERVFPDHHLLAFAPSTFAPLIAQLCTHTYTHAHAHAHVMTLTPRKQDRLHKTNSIYSFKGLISVIKGRRGDKEVATDLPSYRDANTEQAFIGQHPTSHRSSSSRSAVMAWRSQLSAFTNEAKKGPTCEHKSALEISRLSINSARKSSNRLPLPNSFSSAMSGERGLRNQPSMSFPLHLRDRRLQPLASPSSRNSVLFPSTEGKVTCSRQPWWDNATSSSEANNSDFSKGVPSKESRSAGEHASFLLLDMCSSQSADRVNRSISTTSASSVMGADQIVVAETRSSSDASFNTCHSSPQDNEQRSVSGSTPTLYSQRSGICKDACQSPLCDDHASFTIVGRRIEFAEESWDSLEGWGDQPEGLAIDNLHKSVQKYIGLEQDGRQARLQEWTSSERPRQEAAAFDCTCPLLPPQPVLKDQLSLSEFLPRIRGGKEEVIDASQSDESFGSSSLDEEEDAAQICHAWRENIAFAGLGASLVNRPLHNTGDDSIEEIQSRKAAPLRNKASRVSLQTIDLATIQEASIDSLELPSTNDLRNHYDLCAHLFRRALEGKITVVKQELYH